MKNKMLLLATVLVLMFSTAHAIAPDVNLEAHWKLDDLTDSSGNGKTLTNTNAVSNASCYDGTCYDFDGSTAYMDRSDIDYYAQAFTYSAWVNIDTIGTPDTIVAQAKGDSTSFHGILIDNTGHPKFQITTANIVDSTALTPGTWYHVVGTTDGSTVMSLYVDGTHIGTITPTWQSADNGHLYIGKYGNWTSHHFDGRIDEVTVWDRHLNSSEVLDLYTNGIQYPSPLQVINPINLQSFTFDVENTTLEVTTDYTTNCVYDYLGTNYTMDSTDNLTHTKFFDMGSAINSTKQFDMTFYCTDTTNSSNVLSESLTFYQQQTPIALEIFVPQDQQVFDYDTNLITFHIETNYVANCEYLVYNMTSGQLFDNTGNIIHTSDYTLFYPSINEYPTNFTCDGVYVNESITKLLTFFIDEPPGPSTTLGQVRVGEFTGEILQGTGRGITALAPAIIVIVIISVITIGVVTVMTGVLKRV